VGAFFAGRLLMTTPVNLHDLASRQWRALSRGWHV